MAIILMDINPKYDAQSWTQDLNGVLFKLKFCWNGRENVWNCEIYSLDGTLIAAAPLVFGTVIFSDYAKSQGVPSGDFLLVDLTRENPTNYVRDDIGNTVKLFYVES